MEKCFYCECSLCECEKIEGLSDCDSDCGYDIDDYENTSDKIIYQYRLGSSNDRNRKSYYSFSKLNPKKRLEKIKYNYIKGRGTNLFDEILDKGNVYIVVLNLFKRKGKKLFKIKDKNIIRSHWTFFDPDVEDDDIIGEGSYQQIRKSHI